MNWITREKKQQNEENLEGDDFESTPWVQPSIELARDYRTQTIYKGGGGNVIITDLIHAEDLGLGTTLHFLFVRTMTICFFFMGVLSIPALLFASNGSKIPLTDRDPLGSSILSIGNIGYDPNSPTYYNDSACSFNAHIPASQTHNETCLHLGASLHGQKWSGEIRAATASLIVMILEIIQCFIFFVTVIILERKMNAMKKASVSGGEVSMTDYSIMVTGFSHDSTVEQITAHFSALYPLDKVDWRNRPPLRGARPVSHTEYNKNDFFLNSWVADCVIHTQIGDLLLAFKNREHLMKKMYRARAKVKMYGPLTPLPQGPNERLYLKADEELNKIGLELDKVSKSVLDLRSKTPIDGGGNQSADKNFEIVMQKKPVAAFVTFQYNESAARCIEDYSFYKSFPRSLFTPRELKFRGKRVTVTKALEPEEIVWENLEVKSIVKFYKQLRTILFTLVMIVICFIIIVQVSRQKTIFAAKLPSSLMCDTALPSLLSGGTNSSLALYPDITSYSLTRPTADDIPDVTYLDSVCDSIIPGSFYARYMHGGTEKGAPLVAYSFDACSAHGLCPVTGQKVFCPCISSSTKDVCKATSTTCKGSNSYPTCSPYPASTFGSCYCEVALVQLIQDEGVSGALSVIKSDNSAAYCKNFEIMYSTAQGIIYASVLITIVINTILMMSLELLTKWESHSSFDLMQGSLMMKVFISSFVVTVFVPLVAYGLIKHSPPGLVSAQIFQGTFADFTSTWYGTVGSYFISTFIINTVVPNLLSLFEYYTVKPVSRILSCLARFASLQSAVVMQSDLNALQVGPVFDSTPINIRLLSLLYVAMTFGGGLPLLMPLSFATFAIHYFVNKFLLLRYFSRPPPLSDGMMKLLVSSLPPALLLRLAFSIWMFSAPGIFEFGGPESGWTAIPSGDVGSKITDSIQQSQDQLGNQLGGFSSDLSVSTRIFMPNTLPLFIIAILYLLYLIFKYLWRVLPFYWIYNLGVFLGLIRGGDDSLDKNEEIEKGKNQEENNVKVGNNADVSAAVTAATAPAPKPGIVTYKIVPVDDSVEAAQVESQERGQHLTKVGSIGSSLSRLNARIIDEYSIYKRRDPLRKEVCPFTGDYFHFISSAPSSLGSCSRALLCSHRNPTQSQLDHVAMSQGWAVEEHSKFPGVNMRVKRWNGIADKAGKLKPEGTKKTTYEVIFDRNGCNSYKLEKIPAYQLAMKTMLEAFQSALEDKDGVDFSMSLRSRHSDSDTQRHKAVVDREESSSEHLEGGRFNNNNADRREGLNERADNIIDFDNIENVNKSANIDDGDMLQAYEYTESAESGMVEEEEGQSHKLTYAEVRNEWNRDD